jgi:N-acetylmuramoyl-L-alanine amidase
MKLAFSLLFLSSVLFSQTTLELKNRYNTYLNFNGSLNSVVSFSETSFSILNSGTNEFTLYNNEFRFFETLLKSLPTEQLSLIYEWKKNKKLTSKQLDSLFSLIPSQGVPTTKSGLKNRRIAIDPGHFAGNVTDARVEQKFICFAPSPLNNFKDTLQFNEGFLTHATAQILKHQLEEQGAIVMLTRAQQNYTAFGLTYNDWYESKRMTVLDSLLKIKNIEQKKYEALKKQTKEKLFWDFFRDYELAERARKINAFKPDATVIIHYNVDETNKDWLNPTSKNFTMSFIGGGMAKDNFGKTSSKIHFLRLLLSNQLPESEKLASLTVNLFNQDLKIPIAKQSNATYLNESCIKTKSAGVFCRNLALCRVINSPLVYGETLYQDNNQECLLLSKNDFEIYNLKVPKRISLVANCYYKALESFFQK